MSNGTSSKGKALIDIGGGPPTESGYDPIVGMPPPPEPIMEGETIATPTSYTVTFSAVEQKPGAGSSEGKQKTVAFQITITSLTQQNIGIDGAWKNVTSGELPFDTSGVVTGVNHEVDKSEQFEIVVGLNTAYDGGYPVRLVIAFTMKDKNGDNPFSSTYAIKHPSTI